MGLPVTLDGQREQRYPVVRLPVNALDPLLRALTHVEDEAVEVQQVRRALQPTGCDPAEGVSEHDRRLRRRIDQLLHRLRAVRQRLSGQVGNAHGGTGSAQPPGDLVVVRRMGRGQGTASPSGLRRTSMRPVIILHGAWLQPAPRVARYAPPVAETRAAPGTSGTGLAASDTVPANVEQLCRHPAPCLTASGRLGPGLAAHERGQLLADEGPPGPVNGSGLGVPVVVAGTTEDEPAVTARVALHALGIDLNNATPTPSQVAEAADAVLVTAANVHDRDELANVVRADDVVVYLDAGYQGAHQRPEIACDVHPSRGSGRSRPARGRWKTMPRLDRAVESPKASVRAKVEHPFLIDTGDCGFTNTRYRGRRRSSECATGPSRWSWPFRASWCARTLPERRSVRRPR